MNKSFLSVIIAAGMVWGVSAQELSQTLYFDFGTITASQGTVTEGEDANGHHWNNITNNIAGDKYAAQGTVYDNLVNADNQPTSYRISLDTRFSTNGKGGGGGLMTPSAELLGDLAVATATEDYFFFEADQPKGEFTISGLDPQHSYRFHIFGSRKANDTRTGIYTMDGINTSAGTLQAAGSGIGHDGENQNTDKILVSDYVFPDDNGEIVFTITRSAGTYIPLNAMKMEEFTGGRRPDAPVTVVSATLRGSAAENGESTEMHMVSPDGKNAGVFQCFTMLQPGSFSFEAVSSEDEPLSYGVTPDGKLEAGSDDVYTVASQQLSIVRVDFNTATLTITPITTCSMTGSAVHGWSTSNVEDLPYAGNGVWRGEVTLTNRPSVTDRSRFNFILNNSWSYKISKLSGSDNSVGFSWENYTLADINLNFGKYVITLDLNEMAYHIEPADGIDEHRITVMGSSVSNGQGATGNQGYAYMFDQLVASRHQEGLSENPFFLSSIAVNGNNTINLLDRYSELVNDFSRYVIFGVSLGNEGIHGAADQEAVYNQFANNMQLLIAKAREDGMVPVVMNNYTRGDFEASDYDYVRRMNLLINSWDVPSVNLLGAIDNGAGRWADGFQNGDDIYHPGTEGHAELFHAITPSLFDALKAGKPIPARKTGNSMSIAANGKVEFVPEDEVHPFALVVGLNEIPKGEAVNVTTTDGVASISFDGSTVTYTAASGETISGAVADATERASAPIYVTLSHYHAQGRTLLYAGEELLGELASKEIPAKVTILPGDGKTDLSEVMFYRSALNADEVKAIVDGQMIQSSLEVYLPFDDQDAPARNDAQAMTEAVVIPGQTSGVAAVTEEEDTVPFRVYGLEGLARVVVATPQAVAVRSVDGRLIYDREVSATADFSLPAGIYLVNNARVAVR